MVRLDFRRSLVSGPRSSLRRTFGGKSAGSFPEQRLVIEPTVGTSYIVIIVYPNIVILQYLTRFVTQFLADTLTHCADVVVEVENAIHRVFDENAVHKVKI